MGDKTAKTIDFLRARLLAERSVSRTARQRAHELARRVTELEKQLKFVALQRKKAEKATTEVLAILENHGGYELYEPFDSSSDKEEFSSDYKDGKPVESAKHVKVNESDTEGFSSSGVESSSVNGRSLSWKSSKSSSSRHPEKKHTDASRRRRNFTSGKSCRQIRHREHSGSQNDDVANGRVQRTSSEGVRGSATVAVKDKDPLPVPNHGSERDMEKALEHQAQFIARFEAEEKAQREWEDKFRENNGSNPDSGDPGTHSDVTEERDESKLPPCSTENLASEETKTSVLDTNFVEEPKTDTKPLFLDQKNSAMNDNEESDNQNLTRNLVKSYEPTFGIQESEDKLGSVLEALQQAKLSLKQNLHEFPLLQNGPSTSFIDKSGEKFSVPLINSAALFRLPTEYEYGGASTPTTQANTLSYDRRLSLSDYVSGGQFISSGPYRGRGSVSGASFVDDRFRMVPAFPYQETRPANPLQPPSAFDPRLEMGSQFMGNRYRQPDPGAKLPSSSTNHTRLQTRSLNDGYS